MPPADPVWVERVRALLSAAVKTKQFSQFLNVHGSKTPLGRAFLAVVDGEFAVQMALAAGFDAKHAVQWYVPMLPAAAQLAVVQWAFGPADAPAPISFFAEQPGLALDALRWLAMRYEASSWIIVRAWAKRDPEQALQWLMSTNWQSNSWYAVLGVLSVEQTNRVLAWAEGLDAAERPANVRGWAGFTLERRPDLADRLLPLIRTVSAVAT